MHTHERIIFKLNFHNTDENSCRVEMEGPLDNWGLTEVDAGGYLLQCDKNNWGIKGLGYFWYLVGRVFTIGLVDQGSIPGQVIPKTQKMVLDAALLNTQYCQLWIESKGKQSREKSSTLTLHISLVAIEKGAIGSPSTTVDNFTYYYQCWCGYFTT